MSLEKYGIESINNAGRLISLPENSLPWIEGSPELRGAKIQLENGSEIYYASAIGLHSGVQKFARNVPPEQSTNAEQGLFKALPSMLDSDSRQLPGNVDRVPGFVTDAEMYKVSKVGRNAARLYFGLYRLESLDSPLVVKLAIAKHDQQIALQGTIGNVRRRNKHDGGSR